MHLVLEHHRDHVVLDDFVALGVGHQKHVAVLPRLVLRAVDDLAGEGRRGDRIGDEADEAGSALRKGLRERVGSVAEFRYRFVDPTAGVVSDASAGLVVHDV